MGKHSRVGNMWARRSLGAMTAFAAVGAGTLVMGPAAMAASSPGPASAAPGGTVPAGDATGGGAPSGDAGAAQNSADLVPGTPCTITARACVDLATRQAWLISDGQITRGPVPIMPGAPDEPTPVGTFVAQWKDPHHISDSPNHAEMPYSVFFADGGVAFHQGSLGTYSAGCVHLSMDDAKAFYDYLQVGDEVQVH